jgi:hypothetical protein
MASLAPEESDILCESCGYMLNGLPASGNCPECGSAIDLSVSERFRQPPLWEIIGDSTPLWLRFLETTRQIIFQPTRFYRGCTSRGQVVPAYRFAQIHWIVAAFLLGMAAWFHARTEWLTHLTSQLAPGWLWPVSFVALPVVVFLCLMGTIRLAARLTAWEAGYRGFRLPHGVVLRALYYHSAHLLPVALTAIVTCGGYNWLANYWIETSLGRFMSEPAYLYTLSAEVVIAAVYLFYTYWIGMRNWMFANR